jgi:hypothetical protein
MDTDKETRQRRYFQTFRSETKTLALCRDENPDISSIANFVNARIRIRKEDRRLPLQFYVAFEPDGGSPDKAIISGAIQPEVTVREMVLLNRSYIPVVNRIGSTALGGALGFPGRQGCLGFAIDISADCDAVDISLHLGQALGDLVPGLSKRYSGRWICGYSITCNDRLSQEEWQSAVSKCNMQCESYSDQAASGVPVLTNTGSSVDRTIGEDTEGTGGVNVPGAVTQTGTGELG